MGNVIGFVGYECEDIAIYFAKIIHAMGMKTVVVDKSEQEILCEMFDLHEENEISGKEAEYGGVLLTNRGVGQEEPDVIIYLFGYRLNHPKLYECESLIMVTDGMPAHASLLKKTGEWGCKTFLIVRNLIPLKHSEKYLSVLAGREENIHVVPYDERDIRVRCSLSAYGGCEIKRLSAGMKQMLCLLIVFCLPVYQENRVRDYIKKL